MFLTVLACLLVTGVAGCGSSGKDTKAADARSSAVAAMRLCLRHHGYAISPESTAVRRTAPSRFKFITVWNVLNPNRVALAITISSDATGAARAAAWTRQANAKIGKGVVRAPVVRFGRINVLWTAAPGLDDKNDVYGCVRPSS